MQTFRSVSFFVILWALFLTSVSFAATPVLITQSLDDTKLVTLAGNIRPEANKQNDRGPVSDDLAMEHMFLQLKRSPAQEQKLDLLLEQLTDKSSPNFHHWLTARQFGQRFGLATQDLDVIKQWLESYGLTVNVIYTNGVLIDFSGTAAQVRAAFHTEIHNLDVKGVQHIANMSDPKIPAALAPAVVGIASLNDFKPHAMYKRHANYTFGGCAEDCYAVVPGDLATIYNLTPLFNAGISGQGQTIVVFEDTDVYTTDDWTTFRSTFGLSSYTGGSFTQIHPAPPTGHNNCTAPGINVDDVEAILDAEYASAAAPSAAIKLASCKDTNTTFGVLTAMQNLVNESDAPPSVMSISYGGCEAGNGSAFNASVNSAYQQAAAEGVSVFASSGDEGAASCNANDANATYGIGVSSLASTVYNVAVGGTDFGDTYAGTNSTYWQNTNSSTYESALSYVPEIPWNDSCAGELLANYATGSTQTYGSSGFCNSQTGGGFLSTASGSGGPSGCATGSPSTSGVVSGTCAGYAKPAWQSVFGNPSDNVRDIPDVSLFAANGLWSHYYPFCFSDPNNGGGPCTGTPDTWAGGGGTSFASPIMAGIQALVNQNAGGAQGNPNPIYYQLAATEYGASGSTTCNSTIGNATGSTCVFYDVTQGDMDVNCTGTHNCYLPSGTYGVLSTSDSSYQPAYAAQTGWDFATGIGSVNAFNLVNAYAALITPTTTTVLASPTTAFLGQSVTLTATVTPSTATGTVSFYNNDSTTAFGGARVSSGVATIMTTTLPAGTDSITATYTGSFPTSTSTTAAVVVVSTPSFGVNPTTTTATTSQGGTAGPYTITVTSSNGFVTSGQTAVPVIYSCSNLPSEAACTFSPASAGKSGTTSATVMVSITTTAPSAQLQPPLGRGNRLFYAMLLPGFFGILLTAGSRKRAARGMGLLSFIVVLGMSTLWLAACGGSSSSSTAPGNPGTPQGTYKVLVSAQTAAGTPGTSATITLTVN